MGTDDEAGHFSEGPQRGFSLSPDSVTAFYRFALTAYNFRCAITGEQFLPDVTPHPHLEVVLIRPLRLGGQAELGNTLVLEEHVARAFRHRLIQVSDDFGVLVPDPLELEPRLAKHVVVGRKLILPDDPLLHPSVAAISFHRTTAW